MKTMKFFQMLPVLIIFNVVTVKVNSERLFTPRIESKSVGLLINESVSQEFIRILHSDLINPEQNAVTLMDMDKLKDELFLRFHLQNFQHFETIFVVYDQFSTMVSENS